MVVLLVREKVTGLSCTNHKMPLNFTFSFQRKAWHWLSTQMVQKISFLFVKVGEREYQMERSVNQFNQEKVARKKNALTTAFSLACLKTRSRIEEAINSTRNRIYSLNAFYFLLYQRRYFLLVSELIEYACQRQPEIRLRSQAVRVYEYTKIQGTRFQRNYIIARDQKSDLHMARHFNRRK